MAAIGGGLLVSKSPILVFQHLPGKHLGHLFELLKADGMPFQIVRLDLGEPIPDLRSYRALWVLGGSMDVWEEEAFPWLISEKRAIREAIFDHNLPYFGVCLGHQLLADVLGCDVGPAAKAEIGTRDIHFNKMAQAHPWLQGFPESTPLVQWHLAEVKQVPGSIDILATSDACPIHGIAFNDHVLGLQSHIEVNMEAIREWLSSPDAQSQLKQYLGPSAVTDFERDAALHMQASMQVAGCLYANIMQTLTEA